MTSATEPVVSRPAISFDIVVLDTDDPHRLATFYNTLLGWHTEREDDDWITISGDGGARMAFQLALNHQAPTWPDPSVPQQSHLDLKVEDLTAAAAYVESIGGRRVSDTEEDFIVFLDPSGHPFCLCD